MKPATTQRMVRTPGARRMDGKDACELIGAAARFGTEAKTHAIRAAPSAAITPNVACQLVAFPKTVPAGSPRDRAAGVPARATAIALPRAFSGTSRAAIPPMFDQIKPASTPAAH